MPVLGKGAYLKNLERARKALLDSVGSRFSTPTAEEQAEVAKEGLMRPKTRPASMEAPQEEGLGISLMKRLERPKARPEEWNSEIKQPTQADRPSARRSGDANSFRDRLKRSESSGDSSVQITLDDGRKMTGAYQFSDARLKDYMKAKKTEFSTEAFRSNPDLQEEVFQWHIKDIDRTIDSLDTKGMSRDGLRAVAHLGGKTGMIEYVKSGGKYNPADDFGTSLSTYYNKFK